MCVVCVCVGVWCVWGVWCGRKGKCGKNIMLNVDKKVSEVAGKRAQCFLCGGGRLQRVVLQSYIEPNQCVTGKMCNASV